MRIGFPDPVFNNSTFILKTTVMSADRDQRIAENARIEPENARMRDENARIQNYFASIGQNDASIHDKTALIGKLKNDEKAGKLSNKDSG